MNAAQPNPSEDLPFDCRVVLLWNQLQGVVNGTPLTPRSPTTSVEAIRDEALAVSIRGYLEHVVIDDRVALDHLAWLAELREGAHAPPPDSGEGPFGKVWCASVVEKGLDVLSLSELVELAYSPLALDQIKQGVREVALSSATGPWLAAAERVVRCDARAAEASIAHSGYRADENLVHSLIVNEIAESLPASSHPVTATHSLTGGVQVAGPIVRTIPVPSWQIFHMFRERMAVEGDAASRVAGFPAAQRQAVVERLQRIVDRSCVRAGDEFVNLDIEFHKTLHAAARELPVAEAALDAGGHVLREAFRFVDGYVDRTALSRRLRESVSREHQAIVNAIQEGNDRRAFIAVNEHLALARDRWLPDFHGELARKGMGFFDRMALTGGEDDLLIVATVNVTPLEMDHAFAGSIGRSAADAIGRGATLVYLRPDQPLIDAWADLGLQDLQLKTNEISEEFESFRKMVVDVLTERGCYGSKAAVVELVDRRVSQFLLNDEPLFLFTRPSHTVGYHRYHDGREVMTHRCPLSETEACAEIVVDFPSRLPIELFRAKVRSALSGFASSGDDLGLRVKAKALVVRWFPPTGALQPLPERIG